MKKKIRRIRQQEKVDRKIICIGREVIVEEENAKTRGKEERTLEGKQEKKIAESYENMTDWKVGTVAEWSRALV